MITTGFIYLNYMDEQKDYATFVIRHYDSDNKLQLYNQSINVPYYQRTFSQYALNSIYQPVKPSEYPESVYWSFVAFNFDTGMQAFGKPCIDSIIHLTYPIHPSQPLPEGMYMLPCDAAEEAAVADLWQQFLHGNLCTTAFALQSLHGSFCIANCPWQHWLPSKYKALKACGLAEGSALTHNKHCNIYQYAY